MADWNRDLANRISRGELDHAPTPAKADETTDLREEAEKNARGWLEAYHLPLTDGAYPMLLTLTREFVSFGGHARAQREAAHTAEIQAREAEIAGLRAERLKLDKRIHCQRIALRQNWEIVEMRMGIPARTRLWKYARQRSLDARSAEARTDRLAADVDAVLTEACRPSAILLMAGEMTAQERRTARAVANGIASKVRAALPEAITPKETSDGE